MVNAKFVFSRIAAAHKVASNSSEILTPNKPRRGEIWAAPQNGHPDWWHIKRVIPIIFTSY